MVILIYERSGDLENTNLQYTYIQCPWGTPRFTGLLHGVLPIIEPIRLSVYSTITFININIDAKVVAMSQTYILHRHRHHIFCASPLFWIDMNHPFPNLIWINFFDSIHNPNHSVTSQIFIFEYSHGIWVPFKSHYQESTIG